jgi:hypothetical protein
MAARAYVAQHKKLVAVAVVVLVALGTLGTVVRARRGQMRLGEG